MSVTAYVLIQTEVGKAAQVAQQTAAIDGVTSAEDVTGPYDVIVRAEAQQIRGFMAVSDQGRSFRVSSVSMVRQEAGVGSVAEPLFARSVPWFTLMLTASSVAIAVVVRLGGEIDVGRGPKAAPQHALDCLAHLVDTERLGDETRRPEIHAAPDHGRIVIARHDDHRNTRILRPHVHEA